MPGQPIQTNRSLKLALNQQQVLDPACNEHLHPVLNSELQGGVTKYRVYLCKKQGFMNTHKTRSLSAYFSDSLIILISSFKVLGPRATFHFDLQFSCFTYCLTCFMLKIVYFVLRVMSMSTALEIAAQTWHVYVQRMEIKRK